MEPRKSRPRKTKREWPLAPPRRSSEVLYAEVPRNQIALYRFLLEGYDNLAVMSVVDRYRAVIKLRFMPDAEKTCAVCSTPRAHSSSTLLGGQPFRPKNSRALFPQRSHSACRSSPLSRASSLAVKPSRAGSLVLPRYGSGER